MKNFFIIISIFLSFVALSNESSKTVSVFTMEIKPFGFYRKKVPTGLYFDYANKIIETAGLVSKNKIVPFARAHDEVVAGNIDMTIMFDTKELLKDATQSVSILKFDNLIIPVKGKKITKITDIDGWKVGVLRSGCYDIKAMTNIRPKFIEFNDYEQGLALYLSNRIDAICGSLIPMKYSSKEIGIDTDIFKNAYIVSQREAHVHFSKKLANPFRDKLIKAIEKLKKEGYFEKMAKNLEY